MVVELVTAGVLIDLLHVYKMIISEFWCLYRAIRFPQAFVFVSGLLMLAQVFERFHIDVCF